MQNSDHPCPLRQRVVLFRLFQVALALRHILRLFEWFENGDQARVQGKGGEIERHLWTMHQATLIFQFCEGGELLSAIRKGRATGAALEDQCAAC